MLSWPAIFPVLALIAVELKYGAPRPDQTDLIRGDNFLVGYHASVICGATFAALLVTWIVYRLSGRSQTASHIAFFAAIIISCLEIVNRVHRQSHNPGPSSQTLITYPTFGMALAPPPDWQTIQPDRNGMIAKWISPESNSINPTRMIEVVIEIPAVEKLEIRARQVASEIGAKTLPEATRMDGKTIWHVLRDPNADLKPVEAIVASNHEHFYIIYAYAAASASCHDAMDAIQNSWKWTDVESPLRHLEFRSEPMMAFDGRILFNFPAIANTTPSKDPHRGIGLTIENIRSSSFDMQAVLQLMDLPPGDSVETASQRLAAGIEKQNGLSISFVWHTVKGPRTSMMTQPVLIPNAPTYVHVIWAIVQLDGNQIVLINFSIFSRDPIERSEYVACAQQIVESVTINTRADR